MDHDLLDEYVGLWKHVDPPTKKERSVILGSTVEQ